MTTAPSSLSTCVYHPACHTSAAADHAGLKRKDPPPLPLLDDHLSNGLADAGTEAGEAAKQKAREDVALDLLSHA